MEEVRFDDIETLQNFVSDEFGEFGDPTEITQEMVNQFAEVTGDHQWIHVDVERCHHHPVHQLGYERRERHAHLQHGHLSDCWQLWWH